MEDWFDVAGKLDALVTKAAQEAKLDLEQFAADVRPADPRFGDFQANGALPYAKRNRENPRGIAESILAVLTSNEQVASRFELSIAGPGFINFKMKPEFTLEWLKAFSSENSLNQSASHLMEGKTIVVDYGSPNTAKQMHVGHIRSLVIGEAICRLLEFCGAKVIRDNHLGDWGTAYGKLFYAYKRFLDEEALAKDPLGELERLYRVGNEIAEKDEEALQECRDELVNLQNGEAKNVELWKLVNEYSIKGLKEVYELLDVEFDHYLGESFYRDKVDQVYEELLETRIAEESQGALVVFHPEHKRYKKQPFIIRKSDGASNYASTDLATMLYRLEHFKADGIVIVTDDRQKDHFEQLELTTKKWFEKTGRETPKFDHVMFGKITDDQGKTIKSRSGDPIRLIDLLEESIQRSYAIVSEKNPDLPENELQAIAKTVGISSVKYADLTPNRTSDYVFSWEKLLSLDGNTAPYLLYAATRIQSIFRKLEPGILEKIELEANAFETSEEQALARKIIEFVGSIQTTIDTLRPHTLCSYLYELSGAFSSFYNANHVIVDQPDIRARRLLLCRQTLIILKMSLGLLGIQTLERM